jgi:Ig-like domain-containing protein
MFKGRTPLQAFRGPLAVVLASAALLSACAPAQPAPSPEEIRAQVATSVAMTVAAQNTETAAAEPAATQTSTPTSIPFAVPTLTPILPTATTFVIVPPSGGGGGGGGGGGSGSGSPASQKYLCALIGQVPQDGSAATILKVGDTLDVKWTLRNDGTKTWESTWTWHFYSSQIDTNVPSNYDLTMSSVGFQTTLGKTVQPGKTITLGVELHAPNFDGREPIHIGTAWTVIGDGVKFCIVDINVEIIRAGMTP